MRLFCFPSAGGGTAAFRAWAQSLTPTVALCPARLPGRETRLAEAAFDRVAPLVEALAEALSTYLDQAFAFFGHSVGAVIAFELARWLRKKNCPLPACLLVSGARAPQFRLGHLPPPEPPEAEFLEELRRVEGTPKEVLESPELMRLVLPALRADASLYRNYVYSPEPPLDCPIRAYGGQDDERIRPDHLEAWREQTTASFSMRLFPGGHFFLDTNRAQFLETLARDLEEVRG